MYNTIINEVVSYYFLQMQESMFVWYRPQHTSYHDRFFNGNEKCYAKIIIIPTNRIAFKLV